ncbi:PocR ligand-binding domain-containing protein [Indiicoccus explosivorum]|uniref:PocR ligand-binding domain-containing protein n=1 Tax=Indiicoccus explosivorum TaxID=1917864 RepID=UPI000B44DB94|nr:PocR ligand-binding domain-containing protein [Indiicoccus explosivorum]
MRDVPMTSTAELLEDVQKTYASQYGLTLIFTDEQGNVLWSVEGDNELCNRLLQQDEGTLLTEIRKSLNREWRLSRAVIYDMLPGICLAVTPVPAKTGPTYFLWAGVLIEEESQEMAREQLGMLGHSAANWESVLQNTPVVTERNKQQWLDRVNRLAELSALSLQQERTAPPPDAASALFREAIHSESFSFPEFTARFLDYSPEIDFIGLAEPQGPDAYEITEITGPGTEALRGITFTPGEGFLGRSLLTGDRTLWENTERDRRSGMFRAAKSRPKSLFCEPIRRQDGSLSLVFGGSFSNRHISAGMDAESRMLTILLEVGMSVHSLRQENSQQLTRLTSLVDICKLMASAPDLRRILFMLVDISINLVEGPFSCVVLKDRENQKSSWCPGESSTDGWRNTRKT